MYCPTPILAASALIDHLLNHLGWYAGGLIVLIGLFGLGFSDVRRFSLYRTWAIATVCVREAIRRRVLWITPLAIVGMIAVSQLQHPTDEQDAIRQTIKFCLFASGLVVTVTAIILACTNLPREIDSRVIYTIVTKPTTRLEIVLGKVIGFARVSGLILIIMGVSTFAYLELRSWRLESYLRERLASEPENSASRAAMSHYAKMGLLNTRSIAQTDDLQIYLRPPQPGEPRWLAGGMGQVYLVEFDLTEQQRRSLTEALDSNRPIVLKNTMRYRRNEPTEEELKELAQVGAPMEQLDALAQGPGLASAPAPKAIPQIKVGFFDREDGRIDTSTLPEGGNMNLPRAADDRDVSTFSALSPKTVQQLIDSNRFRISVSLLTPTVEYGVGELPTVVAIIDAQGQLGELIEPAPARDGKPKPPLARTARGLYGMQIITRSNGKGTMGVYRFDGVSVGHGDADGNVLFEVRLGIEHGEDREPSAWKAVADVLNRKTGKTYSREIVIPETERVNYVQVPREAVEGGQFDVALRGGITGQWIGVKENSVLLVTANRSFLLNLAKSLLVLWMLSILVVAISICCSTFLSWPIAIVLTLLVLLGRWTVTELGGIGSELGSGITTGLGLDPTTGRVVRGSVYALTKSLDTISRVLPEVSRFAVTEDIERGVSIPSRTLSDALMVLLGYGAPIVVLSYLFLKYKEVAP